MFQIVKSTARRAFGSWSGFAEYITFFSVAIAGMLHASFMWIVLAAMTLFLLSWPRWRELVRQAGRLDRQYLVMGTLALKRAGLLGLALRQFANAYFVLLVVGGKLLHDGLFLAGAYLFGMATWWFWFELI